MWGPAWQKQYVRQLSLVEWRALICFFSNLKSRDGGMTWLACQPLVLDLGYRDPAVGTVKYLRLIPSLL